VRSVLSLLPLLGVLACGPKSSTDIPTDGKPVTDEGSIRLILNDPTQFDRPLDACEAEHCKALLELIEGANESIDFAIYGMRNQTKIKAALVAAKARGVTVRGVVDRDLEGQNYYSSTEALVEAIGDVRSDLKADRKIAKQEARDRYDREPKCERPEGFEGPLQCLAYDLGESCLLAAHASREPIEGGAKIMHDKFFVVDRRFVWTGSTNVSDSGTGGYNANLVTVVDSAVLAGWYTDEFDQMYVEGKYHGRKPKPPGQKKVKLSNAELEVYFSPQESPISSRLRPVIRGAKDRIDIAVFFLTHKHIVADLIDAYRRGVRVRVILDATGAKNGYTKHELLRAAGIAVKVENWGGKMHMKSAVIDGETVITGSMNWTSSGDTKNDENTIIVHSPELAKQYEAFFETIWNGIPDQWLSANPDPESQDSTTACSDRVDNDFDHDADTEDPGCGETPPPLPALPPWRIVGKKGRLTCELGMKE
jgi:phosphatidylserine/phosphatidylglycerophosphate/cardiolipin synthase-like enzyme